MLSVHHVGYVVRSIPQYSAGLPGITLVNSVFDETQQANLSVYSCGEGSMIELIEPLNDRAYTWGHLQRAGEGLHHICYHGASLDAVQAVMREHRMMKVLGPVPAPLFGRDVMFAVTRSRAIIEFLL